VDLYQRVAVRTALVALGRREDAEDVAQEAFLLAWRKLAGFRGDSTFRTWLLTIVWRKALDRRRVRSLWWKRSPGHSATDAPIDHVPSASMTPEQVTVARDHVRRVREEIRKLSPTLRDTLLLAASGEYTYDQIAMMLSVPLGTVKWRVAEARRLVAMRLDQ
jgi:RNA polymerase sigma-70 factor (ECF subfamily)